MTHHIRNRERAMQFVDFQNVRLGGKSLTDVDGLMEWEDAAYILVEVKHDNAPDMPTGQRIALERITDDLHKVKPTLLIIARHNVPALNDVDLAACYVGRYRYNGEWHEPTQRITVRRMMETFIARRGRR